MWFLVYKISKLGFKEAKKHRAKKAHQQNPDITLSPTSNSNDTKTGAQTIKETEMYSFNANTVRNPLKTFLDVFLRLLQFSLGLAVIGMYGGDLQHQLHPSDEKKQGKSDSRWLYAVIIGCLSSLTALTHLSTMFFLRQRTPPSRRTTWVLPVFVWEAIVCLLWLVVFGIFGKIFLSSGQQGKDGNEKMYRAVWVDLVGWAVWAIGMGWCGLRWWKGRTGALAGGAKDVEKGDGM